MILNIDDLIVNLDEVYLIKFFKNEPSKVNFLLTSKNNLQIKNLSKEKMQKLIDAIPEKDFLKLRLEAYDSNHKKIFMFVKKSEVIVVRKAKDSGEMILKQAIVSFEYKHDLQYETIISNLFGTEMTCL